MTDEGYDSSTVSIYAIDCGGAEDAVSIRSDWRYLMYMRIVWGKILPGKWAEFEAAQSFDGSSR